MKFIGLVSSLLLSTTAAANPKGSASSAGLDNLSAEQHFFIWMQANDKHYENSQHLRERMGVWMDNHGM